MFYDSRVRFIKHDYIKNYKALNQKNINSCNFGNFDTINIKDYGLLINSHSQLFYIRNNVGW